MRKLTWSQRPARVQRLGLAGEGGIAVVGMSGQLSGWPICLLAH